MKLSAALKAMLAGWQDDLPAGWRAVLSGTELNFRARALDVNMRPGEVILPGRKDVFRAFRNVEPESVRAVILGQDPYPNPLWATGRAFEQGGMAEWPEQPGMLAGSLRRIVQVLASARTGNPKYVAHDRAWRELPAGIRSGTLTLEPPRQLFDRLEREGVLFLNVSLTVSFVLQTGQAKQPRGHFPLWEPLINRVLSFIAARPAVFLLWGRHACDIFERSGAQTTAVVRHVHPAAITVAGAAFLQPPNPFLAANALLERLGGRPIPW